MRSALLLMLVAGCRIGYDAGDPQSSNRVQSGSVVIADGERASSVFVGQLDLDNTFVIFSVAVDAANPEDVQISAEIESGNTLRFARPGIETAATIEWFAVSSPDITVQRGRQLIEDPVTTIDLSPVDRDQSFPLFSYFTDGTDFGSDDVIRAELQDDSTLLFDVNDDTLFGPEVIWQVVTLAGADASSGTVVIDAADEGGGVPLAMPAPADSFLLFSHDSEDVPPADIAPLLVHGQIAGNGGSLDFSRGIPGTEIELTWHLVGLPAGWRAQRGEVVLESGELSSTISFDAVDLTRSFAFGPLMGRGGRTASTDTDSPGNAWATISIDSSTSGTVTRASATAESQHGWFVVEMP